MKNIKKIYLKIFIFMVVKFSMYLNRRVFVMGRLGDGYLLDVFRISSCKTVKHYDKSGQLYTYSVNKRRFLHYDKWLEQLRHEAKQGEVF